MILHINDFSVQILVPDTERIFFIIGIKDIGIFIVRVCHENIMITAVRYAENRDRVVMLELFPELGCLVEADRRSLQRNEQLIGNPVVAR